MSRLTEERNQDATVYIGNLDERCTEALIWELMLQAGPVGKFLSQPLLAYFFYRVTQTHQGYGFCEYMSEDDADYAIKIMNQIKLYGKPIRVNKATSDKKNLDVGASLFIGNLDPDVDEKMLYDTFSAFGVIVQTPKIARDPDTGNSKGYGFISYDNFDSSDAAIDAMNGQYLMNKSITVSYAFKKDGKGERHGSAAERLLAAQAKKNQSLPNRLFADVRPPTIPPPMMGIRAQIPAPPQINTGMPRPAIQSSMISPTNVYGGYHATGTTTQATTQSQPRPSVINVAQARPPPPPAFGTSTANRPPFSPPLRPPGPYGQYPSSQVTTTTGQAPNPSAPQGYNGYGAGLSR
ncbi:4769_t:CDS:2 [Funneliformis geosporum]|uniref:Splicing factor 3B subunit 4 n=1 Tax=Funneliformis geosporum TaxID=1117311 RepID=A0A9W4WPW6_9GLOM|nr:17648_t:CDS:2 [Funneliformis geosporum]CAI2183908.1 4769_t:CDS:2 [Funneliformis geosporum]